VERLVNAFAGPLSTPIIYHSGREHYGYRYGKPDVRHFCLLKSVQAVSAINAMVALARGGFAQEIGVLVRTLVECTTQIEFVIDALDQNDILAPDVDKYIKDFFADFARNSNEDFRRRRLGKASSISASARYSTKYPRRHAMLGRGCRPNGGTRTSI